MATRMAELKDRIGELQAFIQSLLKSDGHMLFCPNQLPQSPGRKMPPCVDPCLTARRLMGLPDAGEWTA